jgi:hypothetical protein
MLGHQAASETPGNQSVLGDEELFSALDAQAPVLGFSQQQHLLSVQGWHRIDVASLGDSAVPPGDG